MGNKSNTVTKDTMDTNRHEVTELQSDKIYSLEGECLFEGTFTVNATGNERIETVVDIADESVDTEMSSQDIAINFTKDIPEVIDKNEYTKTTGLQSKGVIGEECVEDPSKVADNKETAREVIDLTQSSVDAEETSKHVTQEVKNTMDIDDHEVADTQNGNQCYAIETEFSENPCKVENNETTTGLIDFEELIDIAHDFIGTDTNIPDIQEFERVLSSFPTAGTSNTNVNEILSLDEVDELFENLVTENSSLYSQTLHNVQTSEHTTVKTEDNLDINANKTDTIEEKQSQIKNADSLIKITTVGVELDTEDNVCLSPREETESIDSDGYNSSDFEFITENEAKMDGFIINFTRNGDGNRQNDANKQNYYKYNNNIEYYDLDGNAPKIYDEIHPYENLYDPGEGPSGLNGCIEDCNSREYRANHHVPDEEGYLNLFQGQNAAMPISDIIFLENKSVRPSPMNLQYEGIGFVHQLMRQCQPDSSDEEYADEAKECMEKILFMYPDENRKLRKRRRY